MTETLEQEKTFITIDDAVEKTGTPKNTFRALIRKKVVVTKRELRPGTKQKIVLIQVDSIPEKYYKDTSGASSDIPAVNNNIQAKLFDMSSSMELQKDYIDTIKDQLKQKDETIRALTEQNSNQIKINANLNHQLSHVLQLTSGQGDEKKDAPKNGIFHGLKRMVFGK